MNQYQKSMQQATYFLAEPSDELSHDRIKAMISLAKESVMTVQRHLGLSPSPATFQEALAYELFIRGCPFTRSMMVPVVYKSQQIKNCEYLHIVIDQTLGLSLTTQSLDEVDKLRKANYFLSHTSLQAIMIICTKAPQFKNSIFTKIR